MMKKDLLIGLIMTIVSGCETFEQRVSCIPHDSPEPCPKRSAKDFYDENEKCVHEVTRVVQGPVLSRDPAITKGKPAACCYLVEQENGEDNICYGSGRPLRVGERLRLAPLAAGAWG
jgi:hypothetical protein